jgi:hypothetical protein
MTASRKRGEGLTQPAQEWGVRGMGVPPRIDVGKEVRVARYRRCPRDIPPGHVPRTDLHALRVSRQIESLIPAEFNDTAVYRGIKATLNGYSLGMGLWPVQ